ncbi:MAG: hypothetical protein ABI873_12475 [Marmoricola sp.]
MAEHPAALQLRLLQTVVEVAAERNSTLVLPFPVELLRFLERVTPSQPTHTETPRSLDRPADRVDGPIVAPKAMVSAVGVAEQRLAPSERAPLGFMPGQCG